MQLTGLYANFWAISRVHHYLWRQHVRHWSNVSMTFCTVPYNWRTVASRFDDVKSFITVYILFGTGMRLFRVFVGFPDKHCRFKIFSLRFSTKQTNPDSKTIVGQRKKSTRLWINYHSYLRLVKLKSPALLIPWIVVEETNSSNCFLIASVGKRIISELHNFTLIPYIGVQ